MKGYMKIGIGGLVLTIFAALFGWAIFPKVLRSKVHSQIALKPGSEMRGMWSKLPFALDFRIYLFNVTNPEEIKAGQKPVLKEVGPFYFEEYHEKTNLIDREEDDSVEYNLKNKWIFKPEKSEGFTGQEELTLPHIFILAMIMTTYKEKPNMLPVINKAVNSIFKNPGNFFMKMKAMDLLFNGLPIDCNVQDFPGTAVCGMLKDSTDLLRGGENIYMFSLFGAKNDTPSNWRLRVLRGVKKLNDVGKVIEFDGKKNISVWNNDYCDTFNGTDGTIFHPFLYENEDVVSFSPDLCRSLSTKFTEKVKLSGLTLNRYSAFLGDPHTNPLDKCFCEAPDKCLKKGVMDLYKCAGVPLVASHPHFYLGDEEYLTMVDGLKPSKDEHAIILDFEPFTGSPLSARKRLQFNIMIHKIDKIKVMKNFPDAMLPLFWVEEGITLPEDFIAEVKAGHKVVAIVGYVKWFLILIGLGLCGFAGYKHYRQMKQSDKLEISKVPEVKIKTIAAAQGQAQGHGKSGGEATRPAGSDSGSGSGSGSGTGTGTANLPPKVD